jgi:uncharacterized protein (DUF433 family)
MAGKRSQEGRAAATVHASMGSAATTVEQARGWYLAADVAVLVGRSPQTIAQWSRFDYIRASRSPGPPGVFAFSDVAEAMYVRELITQGVPSAEVRTTVQNARQLYGDWPLQVAPIGIYKGQRRSRIGLELPAGTFDIGQAKGRGGQKFLELGQHLQHLAVLLRKGGWVVQEHPEIEHIEVDPDKLSGQPSILGRRVPAVMVANIATERGGRRTLREDYDLSREEIDDAVLWWTEATKLQAAA